MAEHRMYAAKGLPTAPGVPSTSTLLPAGPSHDPNSDVDMSDSQSEDDAAVVEGDDYNQDGEGEGEHSEADARAEAKPKPSRKLDLPTNLDADLYGLRRSVSPASLFLGWIATSRGGGWSARAGELRADEGQSRPNRLSGSGRTGKGKSKRATHPLNHTNSSG